MFSAGWGHFMFMSLLENIADIYKQIFKKTALILCKKYIIPQQLLLLKRLATNVEIFWTLTTYVHAPFFISSNLNRGSLGKHTQHI